MRNFLIIFSSLLIPAIHTVSQVSEPHSMALDQNSLIVQKEGNQARVNFVCTARVGNCTFEYMLMPLDWKSDGNTLIVPLQDTSSIRSYYVKAKISESTGDYMVRNIYVDFSAQPHASSKLIQSGIMSYTPVTQNIEIEQTVAPESSNFQANQSNVNEFGENYLEANGIVPSLPPIAKIDQLILDSDLYKISSTFQRISEFDQNCTLKMEYLRKLIPRIEQHIDYNKQMYQNEALRADYSQETMKSLEEEKKQIEGEMKQLSQKEDMKRELDRLEDEKQRAFSRYYSYEIIASRYMDKLKHMINVDLMDSSEFQGIREEVEANKKQIESIDQEIKKLLKRKKELQEKVRMGEKKIQETEQSFQANGDPKRIKMLEDGHQQYSKLAEQYKIKYQMTEELLAMAKNKFQRREEQMKGYKSRMTEIDDMMRKSFRQDISEKAQELKRRIDVLERNLPKLQRQIDHCGEDPSRKASAAVIDNAQRKSSDGRNRMNEESYVQSLRRINSRLSAINIFSSGWIIKYGVPKTFSFTCKALGTISGYGYVRNIVGGSIEVADPFGNNYILRISFCTKLMGKDSSYVPKINDMVDWTGTTIETNIYSTYRAYFYPTGQMPIF